MLLTFLLNACWQITVVAMAAALCGRLLRGTAARYRHLLWVIALVSSFCLPLLAGSGLLEGKSSDQARAQVWRITECQTCSILGTPNPRTGH